MPSDLRSVDPLELRVPSSRPIADPAKLQRQIAKFGKSIAGMPPLLAYEYQDGSLLIVDGITRATRASKLAPTVLVPVEVIGVLRSKTPASPRLREVLQ